MTQPAGHVELVIRTASSLLIGRLAPREAVTILATQTPLALERAAALARTEPELSRNYAAVVRSVYAELAGRSFSGTEAHDVTAVREDLAALSQALETSSGGSLSS
ncbi:MAG: hypothetical protein M3179_08750 [Actinomycetota bacterium]|nr:hypothetical protein [Actinomycetota bacterium]